LKRKTGTYSGHAFTTVQQDATVWLATTIPTSSSTAGDAEQQEQQGKHDVSEDPVPPAFWSVVSEALQGATSGAVTAIDIADCTIFLPTGTIVKAAQNVKEAVVQATSAGGKYAPAALTMVELGLGAGAAAKVRCTALMGGAGSKKVFTAPHVDAAVSTTVAMVTPATGSPAAAAANVGALSSSGLSTTVVGGFAYVSGAAGIKSDGTDVFADIEASLVAAGSQMNLILNCLFWVAAEECIDPFFGGFFQVFNNNTANFPPPSRTEFVGVLPGTGRGIDAAGGDTEVEDGTSSWDVHCPLVAKCVAAMPCSNWKC